MGTYSWDLDGGFNTALSESIRYPRLPICCEYPDASLEPTTPTEIGLLPDTESALALTPTLGHDSIGARSERRRWILARSDLKPLLPLLAHARILAQGWQPAPQFTQADDGTSDGPVSRRR